MIRRLQLRLTTLADAPLLYAWRNDSETIRACCDQQPVQWENHRHWLEQTLGSPDHRLCLVMLDGRRVGHLRATRRGRSWELSWTVAPEQRRHGIGSAMVGFFLSSNILPAEFEVRAKIKPDNLPSLLIALRNGLRIKGYRNGLVLFAGKTKKEDAETSSA